MSRHRDVRNLDYDEEYDEAYDDAVYGHSVDDHEYGVSPNTEQYLYSQRDANYGFGAYFPESEKIEEEDLEDFPPEHKRRDSSNYERPRLSSEDEVKLNSVLDEVRNVVGDQFSEADLVREILDNKYDFESSLNAVLTLPISCGSTTLQSLGHQAAAQLPRTPKREQPLRMPDETSKFSPFSFMLPLSYCFSSAFVLEKGHYERLPITKYVKEWKQMLRKISKEDKEKTSLKEYENVKKIIPLSEHEKKFLVELNGLSLEQIDSQLELNISPSFNDAVASCGSLCKKDTSISTSCLTSVNNFNYSTGTNEAIDIMAPVHVSQATPSNLLAFNETTSAKMTLHDTDNSNSNLVMRQSTFANDVLYLVSSPPPGFIGLDLKSNVLTSPHNLPSLNTQSKLSILATTHLAEINSVEKNCHKTKPIGNISPLGNKTSLSALASAHLGSQSNNNYFSIPSLSTSSLNNVPPLQSIAKLPLLNCTIPAFTSVPKSEAVIPQLHTNVLRNTQVPIIPSLNFSIPKLRTTHDNMPERSIYTSLLPSTSLSCSQSNLPSSLNMQTSNVFPFQSTDTNTSVELSSDDAISPSIDLNIALNKNKNFDFKTALSNSVVDTKKLTIELMPSLTFAERRCLRINPSTCFGKVMLHGKRSCRRKFLIRRQLFLPYRPFDFSIPSPDDVVRKTFEKNVPKYG